MAVKLEELVLEIKVQNDKLLAGLDKAEGKIDNFSKRSSSSFKKINKAALTVAASFAVIGFAANKLSGVIIKFEKLEASLKTVTGSAEKAEKAFAQITNFAATTPFQLDEVVASFIKLKALGLDPSEAALRSYGNTASAMGRSLNQMIEAVADATTGEFERLKEFGIKARSQGEDVTFTFQGIATTVGKNAKEITKFLQSIGDVNFAGAMAEQADTLGVATSNMGDAFDKLAVTIGKAGVGDLFRDITLHITAGVAALDDYIDRTFILSENIKLLGFESQAQFDEVKKFVNMMNEEAAGIGGVPTPQKRPDDDFQGKLEKIREQKNQEMELEKERQEKLKELEDEAEEERLKKIEDWEKRKQEIIAESQNEITNKTADWLEKIKAMEELKGKQRVQVGAGMFGSLLAEGAKHNKKLFELNKAAGIANTVIYTAEGMMKAIQTLGPIAGPVAAAGIGAMGAAQIATISSQSFGGGGGGAAASPASVASTAPTDGAGGGGGGGVETTFNITGIDRDSTLTGQQLDDIISGINDRIESGAIIKGINFG